MSFARLAVIALTLGYAGSAGAQAQAASPLAPLEFLVGSCWAGDFPGGKPTDRHCFEWMYDRKFIRDRHVVSSAPKYEGESIYSADAKTGKISYTYWSSAGLVLTGSVEEAGNTLVFPSRYSTPQGDVEIKAVWTKTGPDGYRVANFQKSGSDWKELWTMEMRRVSRTP